LAARRASVGQVACNFACNLSTIPNEEGGRSLPLVKTPPKKPKTTSLQVRIEEEVQYKLGAYAEFIDSSPSYVVTEALKLLFKRDEEFKQWLTQHAGHNNNHEPKGGKSLFETVEHA
jgi:predicted transcriptional regulator